MPSVKRPLSDKGVLKAIEAKMASLCEASIPSTSNVGSASAYPFSWASIRTSLKFLPLVSISDKIKLVVPLIIPASQLTRLADKPSRRDLMIGIPPATAAS